MPDHSDSAALRIGVMGCGIIAQTHLHASQNCPCIEITAASSRSSSALASTSDECGIPNRFDDWRALIECREVDAVLICLPDGLHEEATCQAARCGKHVLVEKAMASSLAQSQSMVQATNAAGVVLMVAQVVRQLPSHQLAKRLLHDGKIGSVEKATRRRLMEAAKVKPELEKRPWIHDRGLCTDPLLFGFGSHEFDALLWLLGTEARTVQARGKWYADWSSWERIESSISTRSGINVQVLLSLDANDAAWDTVIQGSDGTITLFDDRVVVDDVETACPWTHDEVFAAQLNEFAICVRDGREPGPSGRHVLPTMSVLGGVLESLEQDVMIELPIIES